MAYKQVKKYGYRDSLEKGDPEKVIYGVDFDAEFEAIEKAIADIDPDADGDISIDEIDGLQDALDDKADKDHTHDEYLTDAPNNGKQYVRESEAWAEVVIPDDAGIPEPNADATPYARRVEGGQTVGAWVEAATPEDIEYLDGRIDAIEGSISDGGGFVEAPDDGADYARNGKSPAWVKTYSADYIDDLEVDYKNADAGKADKDHTHEIADVDGLQDALDAAPAWDEITGKPTEFPPGAHAHDMGDVDGLEGKIGEIEGAIGELTGQLAFGGSYNAATGTIVTGNLPEFIAGQPLPSASSVPNTFVIVSVSGDNPEELGEGDWLVAGQAGWVAVKYGTAGSVDWDNIVGKPTEFPSANAVLITGDQTAAGHKTWTGIATFGDTVILRGSINGDDTANFQNAVTAGSIVKAGGTADQYLMADGSVSTGSLADGTVSGQITTWDGAEWTPESAVVYDGNTLKISGTVDANKFVGDGSQLTNLPSAGAPAWGEITGKPALDNYGSWKLQASGGSTENVTTGESVNFVGSGGTTVSRNGTTITISSTSGGGLPDGDWACTGSITAAGNITAYSSSDERLKDDITPMPVGLIDDIKPVQFKWKDSGKPSGGVIAQQLQAIGLDDFVHEAPNGDLGVDYNALVGVLLTEVIELKRRLSDDQ